MISLPLPRGFVSLVDRRRRARDQPFVVSRVEDADALLAALEPHEPRSSAVMSVVRGTWLERRRLRVVVAADGTLAAVVGFKRLCFDVWAASAFLADHRGAAAVADVVNRSPARSVSGVAVDVEPLIEHLDRVLGWGRARNFVARRPVDGIVDAPDDRTRVATLSDLDALVDLYRTYELAPAPTVWQLRRYLRHTLANDMIVVAVDGDDLIGAGVLGYRTDVFVVLTNLVVAPAHRGSGLSWELIKRTGQVASDANVGVVMSLAPTNPMSFEHGRVDRSSSPEDHHCSIAIGDRWRGKGRLRSWMVRLDAVEPRRIQLYRDIEDPDRPAP